MAPTMNEKLKAAIFDIMPKIDSLLENREIYIHQRYLHAAKLFLEYYVIDFSYKSLEELQKSKEYFEIILPIFNDWYWEKYNELARSPSTEKCLGILSFHNQPISIEIPLTTSKVEVHDESAWLTFPDHLQETESLESMLSPKIDFKSLNIDDLETIKTEAAEIVSLTRKINLNLNSANFPNTDAKNMARGVWSHIDKAVTDILTYESHRASIACWEIHLALEKSFKVLIHSKLNEKATGHDLKKLHEKIELIIPNMDITFISELPSDKDAINLRYSEKIRSTRDAAKYYKIALNTILVLTERLNRSASFANVSLLMKKSPLAK